MRFLLDTHVIIWSMENPEKLGYKTRELLTDFGNQLFVSSVSAFEVAQAIFAKKLILSRPVLDWIQEARQKLTAFDVPLSDSIAIEA